MQPTLLEVRVPRTIEQGALSFLYRPRISGSDDELQRLFLLMSPSLSEYERLIAVGRERKSRRLKRERFWGFVDMVLTSPDMTAALSGHVYRTSSRRLRHVPAAHVFAEGTYTITVHGNHSHLRWHVHEMARDPIAFSIQIERDADHLLTIANPDPSSWGLAALPDLQSEVFDELELHVRLPAALPPQLQERFGDRHFTHVDCTDWLDHPGAEILFATA